MCETNGVAQTNCSSSHLVFASFKLIVLAFCHQHRFQLQQADVSRKETPSVHYLLFSEQQLGTFFLVCLCSIFLFLSFQNAVLMLWLGLHTKHQIQKCPQVLFNVTPPFSPPPAVKGG